MLRICSSFVARAAFILVLFFESSGKPALCADDNYELEVIKSKRTLLVKHGLKIEKQYPVATGRGGRGDKRYIGDKKTPIGTYRIIRFNENSQFYYFMQLNYPNAKDAFQGLKNRFISRLEFGRIIDALLHRSIPPQNTRLGGLIGIHGIGGYTSEKRGIHDSFDWTKGCIALTNEHIEELKKYVSIGTKVVINE